MRRTDGGGGGYSHGVRGGGDGAGGARGCYNLGEGGAHVKGLPQVVRHPLDLTPV